MTRNLPVISELADALARSLEASTSVLSKNDVALAIAGRHLLLIRDHGHSVSLSLPTKHHWSWRTADDMTAGLPVLQKELAAYRAQYPNAMAMADVIVALAPTLSKIAPPWQTSFPGTPIPSECWLESSDGRCVGVFQSEGSQFAQPSAKIVIWLGDLMKTRGVTSPASLASLGPWLEPMLEAQEKGVAKAQIEERKKALPLPTLESVMARLRGGDRIQTGGGRWYQTFFLEGATLRCENFDEGQVDVADTSVDELTKSITSDPDAFR